MKGHPIPYSTAEMVWLEANRLLPIADYHRAWCAHTGRTDVKAVNLASLRKRMGWLTGRTGRFVPGQPPHNRGKPCPPGSGGRHPNAAATHFRKGERRGRAAQRYKPIGTERLSKEGYLERKVHDGLPLQSRWRAVHLIEWEAVNGPVPPKHALKCLDGDRRNTDPSNWQVVPRALLPALNGGRFKKRLAYDDAAPEVKPSVMAIAQVEHALHQHRRKRA